MIGKLASRSGTPFRLPPGLDWPGDGILFGRRRLCGDTLKPLATWRVRMTTDYCIQIDLNLDQLVIQYCQC